jgi:hypothetical protein
MGEAQQVARLRANLALLVDVGAARPWRLDRGRERAAAGIGDAMAHHDDRHIAATRQPDQQLRASPSPGRVVGGQRGPPDERGARRHGAGGGLHPLGGGQRSRHGVPLVAEGGGQPLADVLAVGGGVGPPLLQRGIRHGPRRRDRLRVVVEVDAPAAARGGRSVEHRPTPAGGFHQGEPVIDRCHVPEGSDRYRQSGNDRMSRPGGTRRGRTRTKLPAPRTRSPGPGRGGRADGAAATQADFRPGRRRR